MVALAVVLIAVGAFGSWVSVSGAVDLRGIEGDGVITLTLALIAAGVLLVARARGRRASPITLGVCAVLVAAVAGYDTVNVLGTDFGPFDAHVGWGLWLTLIGALGLLAALRSSRSAPS